MSFSLKVFANGFATAWKDLKKVGTETAVFLNKNQATIQKAISQGSAVAESVDPALTPALTAFDAAEEAVMGKVFALANNTTTAVNAQSLFQDEWPLIMSIKDQLVNHPAVTAAPAAIASMAEPNQ